MEESVSRRDFSKLVGAAAAGVLAAGAAGAASAKPAFAADRPFTSMTEEERASIIANPIFMGNDTNAYGQVIKTAEMWNGGIAPEYCAVYNDQFDRKLYEVIPGKVWCYVGATNANCTMIMGETGLIVIDTEESNGTAKMALDAIRQVTDAPVVAVFYTHNDYVGGTATFVGAGNPNNVPIVCCDNLVAAKYGASAMTQPAMTARALRQVGMMMPKEGPDACVGAGMGRYMSAPDDPDPSDGFIVPNITIDHTKKMEEMEFDGVRVQFWPLVSDSVASMNMWFPDLKLAVSNHFWNAAYNTYPLRGMIYRDPEDTLNALDINIAWEPEYQCSCHGLPVTGAAEIKKQITAYRDSIQFIYDQTIRWTNKGLRPDDIVKRIKFPKSICESERARPLYGDYEYFIRGVYGGMLGWFDGDVEDLHPVDKAFESKYFIQAMGGVDVALQDLRNAFEDRQWSWACTLAAHILRVDPKNAEATSIKAECCRQMGYLCLDSSSRNYYLTEALVLEGKIPLGWTYGMIVMAGGYSSNQNTLFLRMLGITLDPEKAEGVNKTIQFNWIDKQKSATLSIHNCVAQAIDGPVENPDFVINMPYMFGAAFHAGSYKMGDMLGVGQISIQGDKDELRKLFGMFELDVWN